ncbi:hypothetical protein SCHPADRAFT_294801 [Schizopora paradoxa]|uniref:Uncharacterized protein n=1 Tax=Schizopora paradoxa TaxID=27342 RepID=A0A0H2RT99_9AGAM|nr:hypothetical protein SCHPADRAFT_294801 [Schizopora paradoxa]
MTILQGVEDYQMNALRNQKHVLKGRFIYKFRQSANDHPFFRTTIMADPGTPETKPKLEFPLFPKEGPTLKSDMKKAHLVKPMARIPSVLLPSEKNSTARPPKLHYGWAMHDPYRLLEVARALNVPPRKRYEGYVRDERTHTRACMTDIWMWIDALGALTKELELRAKPYLVEVFCPGKPGEERVDMIALIDNYTLKDGFVSRSDIQKLKAYFGFESDPLWYLDTYHWCWNSESYWS